MSEKFLDEINQHDCGAFCKELDKLIEKYNNGKPLGFALVLVDDQRINYMHNAKHAINVAEVLIQAGNGIAKGLFGRENRVPKTEH